MLVPGFTAYLAHQTKRPARAGLFSNLDRSRSISGRCGAAPVEAIIQTDLHGVVVVAKAAERSQSSRANEPGAAEVIILILDLGGPARSEHVFQAGADGVAVTMTAIQCERDRRAGKAQAFAVIGKGITALGVQQSRTPIEANAASHRANGSLVVGVDKAAGEDHTVVVPEPAVLPFETNHPVGSELVVRADLHASEESAIVIVAGDEPVEIVVAGEGAADMPANVETGPVVDGCGVRSLGVIGPSRSKI